MMVKLNNLELVNFPYLSEIKSAIEGVMQSNVFLRGAQADLFEAEWAQYCGQEYCVACKNGTDALTLSTRAMGLKEVFVQDNTLPLTAQGLSLGGAQVNLIDVDANGRGVLTDTSSNWVPVLLYGRIPSAAEQKQTLFDAAHAHGWRPPQHATACWSFYPTKTLGAFGDAGAITTNDLALVNELKSLCGRDDQMRNPYQLNSRIDELQATILRVKLRHLDYFISERKRIATLYRVHMHPLIEFISHNDHDLHHLLVIRVKKYRDQLQEYLRTYEIETKVHFPTPLHTISSNWKAPLTSYPGSDSWSSQVLSIPCYPNMDETSILYVCERINAFLDSAKTEYD